MTNIDTTTDNNNNNNNNNNRLVMDPPAPLVRVDSVANSVASSKAASSVASSSKYSTKYAAAAMRPNSFITTTTTSTTPLERILSEDTHDSSTICDSTTREKQSKCGSAMQNHPTNDAATITCENNNDKNNNKNNKDTDATTDDSSYPDSDSSHTSSNNNATRDSVTNENKASKVDASKDEEAPTQDQESVTRQQDVPVIPTKEPTVAAAFVYEHDSSSWDESDIVLLEDDESQTAPVLALPRRCRVLPYKKKEDPPMQQAQQQQQQQPEGILLDDSPNVQESPPFATKHQDVALPPLSPQTVPFCRTQPSGKRDHTTPRMLETRGSSSCCREDDLVLSSKSSSKQQRLADYDMSEVEVIDAEAAIWTCRSFEDNQALSARNIETSLRACRSFDLEDDKNNANACRSFDLEDVDLEEKVPEQADNENGAALAATDNEKPSPFRPAPSLDRRDDDEEAPWLACATTFESEQSRESYYSSQQHHHHRRQPSSSQATAKADNQLDCLAKILDDDGWQQQEQIDDESNRKSNEHSRCSRGLLVLKGLYEILGVLFDVITATIFLVHFRRHYDGHQGLQALLFATLFLPGTVLTYLWMRHQFPMATTMPCCGNNGQESSVFQMLYGIGLFLLSFCYSWFLFPIFLVADLAAIFVGPDVYSIFLRTLPQEYLEVRRLVYAACQDVGQLAVQLYVIATPHYGLHGAVVSLAFICTLLNLCLAGYTLWKHHEEFAGSQVTLSLYVKNLLGLVPKDRRFAVLYTDMLRQGTFPYEHVILQNAGLDDIDVITLVDALVQTSDPRQGALIQPRTLQLRGNKLTDLAVSHIALQLSLGRLPQLELLDVSENRFGDTAIHDFADCLKCGSCRKLRALNIEGNGGITHEGYNSLARAIRTDFQTNNNLSLEVLVMDHKGPVTELLREVCIRSKVETFFPVQAVDTDGMDSEATVIGSVRMATRYFFFGKRQYS